MRMATICKLLTFFIVLGNSNAYGDDFASMLQDVNATHPALQAEREQLAATKQGVFQAYSAFLPNASAGYDQGRQRVQYNNVLPDSQTTSNKRLSVTQALFQGDAFARIGVAYARADGGEAHLKQLQQQVLLSAIAAYVDVVEKQRVLTISRENVDALTTHLAATHSQFDMGELTITDVSQSEARLSRAQAELHDAEAALANARDAYIRETGKEPAMDNFPTLPATLPSSPDEISAEVADHPAVLEAKQNEKIADYTVDERKAAMLPSVRLEGNMNDVNGTTQPGINTIDDRSVMMRVSIPIFQSGAEYSRISEASHQYARSRHETTDITRETLQTGLREWNNYQAATAAISEHEQALAAGEKALDSVQKEKMAGTRTVLDVLNEQDELYTSKINLIRAQSRQVLGAYRLLAAVGKLDTILTANPG